jgi:hypothetical protein
VAGLGQDDTPTVRDEGRWRPRFALAAAVRLMVYGVPLLAGSAVAWVVSRVLDGAPHRALVAVTVLGAAVAASLLVSRLTMRLMPLAVLLRMTMIFPDRAPSRVKVARLANSASDIGARVRSRSADESDAAMTMLSLVTALGRHDRRTRGHSERVRLFCDLLSDELKLSPAEAGRLRWAALIHDIGKLEIPEEILNKPTSLTEEEWTVVRRHPIDGARLAWPLASWLGPWFAGIAHHHERWDGSGYPMGLVGEEISASGRAIAVVDSFETMTSARAYKTARSTVSARAELARCAGTHFDPTMVRAFLAISLPKMLWSVGPLAFLLNVRYLRWAVEGGARTADIAVAATAATANAAGVTVLAVSVGALPASTSASAVPHVPTGVRMQAQADSGWAPAGRWSREEGTFGTLRLLGRQEPGDGSYLATDLPAAKSPRAVGLQRRPDVPARAHRSKSPGLRNRAQRPSGERPPTGSREPHDGGAAPSSSTASDAVPRPGMRPTGARARPTPPVSSSAAGA